MTSCKAVEKEKDEVDDYYSRKIDAGYVENLDLLSVMKASSEEILLKKQKGVGQSRTRVDRVKRKMWGNTVYRN